MLSSKSYFTNGNGRKAHDGLGVEKEIVAQSWKGGNSICRGLQWHNNCRVGMLNMLAERGMNKIIFDRPRFSVQLINC